MCVGQSINDGVILPVSSPPTVEWGGSESRAAQECSECLPQMWGHHHSTGGERSRAEAQSQSLLSQQCLLLY